MSAPAASAPDLSGVWGMERWYLKDASDVAITGLRPERPPPKIEGQVLINEMTMNDAAWYADTGHKVTVVYRRLDDVMLEGNCAEGIWMEALEATAAKEGAGTD